jgi:hypothetical protein
VNDDVLSGVIVGGAQARQIDDATEAFVRRLRDELRRQRGGPY